MITFITKQLCHQHSRPWWGYYVHVSDVLSPGLIREGVKKHVIQPKIIIQEPQWYCIPNVEIYDGTFWWIYCFEWVVLHVLVLLFLATGIQPSPALICFSPLSRLGIRQGKGGSDPEISSWSLFNSQLSNDIRITFWYPARNAQTIKLRLCFPHDTQHKIDWYGNGP